MNHSSPIDFLLVGTGDIARKRVAPALIEAPSANLLGVVSRDRARAEAFAREFGARETFDDLDQALTHTRAPAVYLATPVDLHVPQAIRALDAGKHVLIEKPLALDAAEALRAADAADAAAARDLRAGCAYYRRAFPRFAMAKQMIESGEFGRILLVRMVYHAWFNPAPDDPKYWRVVKNRGGGGPLADMGSHMFDLLIALLGMPRSVYARAATLTHPYEAEDSAAVMLEMDGGALVSANFHWNSKTWAHELEIVGTEARLKWSPFDSGPILKTVGRDTQQLDLPAAANVHTPLIEDFADSIVKHRDPLVPLAEAARTNLLLDAIYRSAREERPVTPQSPAPTGSRQ